MTSLKAFCIVFLTLFALSYAAFGEDATFGLLSKSIDDHNFVDTARGCQDAAILNGDRCVHVGGKGAAAPREQVAALKNALRTEKLSALAISVVMSDVLAEVVRRSVTIPVITFDSPFSGSDASLSQAYVGTDNVAFGRDLAKIVKQFRPRGGSVFLMGDMHDTNLAQRILGVRRELSQNPMFPSGRRLNGEGGWTESARSPWNSGDDVGRTMEELSITFDRIHPDVFIAVGHWPLVDPDAYRKTVAPYQEDLVDKKTVMVVGVGKILPQYKDLIDKGLVHGLVSIDFFKIGQLCYQLMRALSEGRPVPSVTYVPNTILIGR